MGLRNAQYHAIMREYEKRQLKSHDIQTARYEEVYTKLPEFKSLDDSISILSVQYGKKLLNGDPTALSSLKEELALLRASKKKLLTSAGYPENYLEPVYETYEGWRQDVSSVREYEKLPENCKKYLARLEELLEVPISIVSVGPDREQTIFK